MVGITTIVLTNVGLSIFNNWANNRQTQELTDKRMELERAVNAGQRERVLTLLQEGQKLTLKLEEEKHQERLKELNSQFDDLIKELAYSATIEYWPLKTLPIVMKNQALGNLLANIEDKVALHCILTPSNCRCFNKNVLQSVECELETYCNIHWNNISGSPILFYSGAWTTGDAPTGTQVDSLRTALSNLPTLLITPYFRPSDGKLVFHVYTWGVGSDNNNDRFIVPEIEPTEFQRNYTFNMNWQGDQELIDNAVEDIVPYLQYLIGCLADTYFWSAFGAMPRLPRMLAEGVINTDGMKYLVKDAEMYYNTLLKQEQCHVSCTDYALLCLNEGLMPFFNDDTNLNWLYELILRRCNRQFQNKNNDIDKVVVDSLWLIGDLDFIDKVISIATSLNDDRLVHLFLPIKNHLQSVSFDYSILDMRDVNQLKALADGGSVVAMYRLGELFEYSLGVEGDDKKSQTYYKMASENDFLLANIKLGKIMYEDLDEIIIYNMHVEHVIQIEDLYISYLLQKNKKMKTDEFWSLYRYTTEPYMASGKIYTHPGLIYNLAKLIVISDINSNIAKSMLQIASKLGYKKADILLTNL